MDAYLAVNVGESPAWLKGAFFGVWLLIHGGLVLTVIVVEVKSLRGMDA